MDGGCTCKALRYRMTSRPLIVHCCHCRWCQRESGAAFALNAMIEADRVVLLTGVPEVVLTPSDSGLGQKIARCPSCRVALWSNYAGSGDRIRFVRVGTLDDPDRLPRLGPLKAGRAQASAMGVGGYFAQEGMFEFAVRDWGPQPLEVLLASVDCNGVSVGIAKDTGAKEIKDLKGKRVGFVVGSPAMNQNMLALLAFGGVRREDVTITEFASFGAMWKGVVNNDVDAAVASAMDVVFE